MDAAAPSETRESPEGAPATGSGTEQSPPSATDPADTSSTAAERPVSTADGGWQWEGLRLTPEDNLIADQALDARRLAEGRDTDGEYGDRGLTPDMRRVEQESPYGELVPGTEKHALEGSDRFKEKLAKRITLEPDKSTAELAADIHDNIRHTFPFPMGGRKALMLSSETKYFAVIGRGRTIDDPSGLVRQRPTAEGVADESIRRDLTWGPTDVFQQAERGEEPGLPELAEISEPEADGLIERFRRKWSGDEASPAVG
ncbi:hypothetical protein [Actinoallomurus sp. NPDC050550]|uniref:hypothetical protein n=1 Tax=Actinoallomurus sp. NPDC050550 TaxID=3154937 RepID=UPI0033D54F6D